MYHWPFIREPDLASFLFFYFSLSRKEGKEITAQVFDAGRRVKQCQSTKINKKQ